MLEGWVADLLQLRASVTARKAFSRRGRAATGKERVVAREMGEEMRVTG